jgi:hypothetical protein
MELSYKSKALALLMPVVSETLTKVVENPVKTLSPLTSTTYGDFQRDLTRLFATIVTDHRKKIYAMLSSAEFAEEYPEMTLILKLPVSNLRKSIIFLTGIGCTTEEISHILQSEKSSVSVMRSTSRCYIAEIFSH